MSPKLIKTMKLIASVFIVVFYIIYIYLNQIYIRRIANIGFLHLIFILFTMLSIVTFYIIGLWNNLFINVKDNSKKILFFFLFAIVNFLSGISFYDLRGSLIVESNMTLFKVYALFMLITIVTKILIGIICSIYVLICIIIEKDKTKIKIILSIFISAVFLLCCFIFASFLTNFSKYVSDITKLKAELNSYFGDLFSYGIFLVVSIFIFILYMLTVWNSFFINEQRWKKMLFYFIFSLINSLAVIISYVTITKFQELIEDYGIKKSFVHYVSLSVSYPLYFIAIFSIVVGSVLFIDNIVRKNRALSKRGWQILTTISLALSLMFFLMYFSKP